MAAYRLGFAVKILGEGGVPTSDTRRHASGPHLRRSIELLAGAFDYLDRHDLRMFRLSSSTVPYGTHPDLPALDFRRQIGECEADLRALGARARALGLRLSTHPGQYTVINGPDQELRRKSSLDLEQDARLLDAMGLGPEAVVVVHVGGVYGDKPAALGRFAAAYEALSERARERLAVENDESSYTVADTLWLHRRTGVKLIYDHHHHRLNSDPALSGPREALAAALGTWPAGVRPKIHLSSPRTELRTVRRRRRGSRGTDEVLVAPLLDQHADFVPPWDLADVLRLAELPVDVMVEAKAKDLAVLRLRAWLARTDPVLAAAEERGNGAAGAPGRLDLAGPGSDQLSPRPEVSTMSTAREIMTGGTECVGEDETILDAARKLADLDVGALPICGNDDRLRGMLTDRDIVVKVLAAGKDPSSTKAGELGEGKPVTIGADDSAEEALETMISHRVRRLPVIDGHRLVGIVSQADIARHLSQQDTGRLVEAISTGG